MKNRYFWILLSILSALFLILSFHNSRLSCFAWISLVPMFFIIMNKKLDTIVISSIITGVIFNTLYLIWMKEYKHPASLPGVVIVETFFFCIAVILTRILYKNIKFLGELCFPIAWVSIDYIKTVGYLAFPWGILGYSQYKNLILIQTASIFGVWGITFLIIYFNAILASIIYQTIRNKSVNKLSLLNLSVMGLLFSLSIIFGFVELKDEKAKSYKMIKVSLIQANFNPWDLELNKNIEREIELTKKSLLLEPDLVVWSESSVPFPYEYYLERNNKYACKVHNFISSTKKTFVIGTIEFNGQYENNEFIGDFYNVALCYNDGKLKGVYRKIHLVPFGEWFPYKKIFPFVARILENAGAGDFRRGNDFMVFDAGEFKFNVLICFEDVFGDLTRRFISEGSDLLINVTNDAWTGSNMAEIQHFSLSVFRTIENRRSLIRAANGGVTAIVNPYGRVLKSLDLFKSDYLVGLVPIESEDITIYTKFGDFLPCIILIGAIIMLLFSVIKKMIDIVSKRNIM